MSSSSSCRTASRCGSFRSSRKRCAAAVVAIRIEHRLGIGRPSLLSMGLCDEVRRRCAEIAAAARSVRIDTDRLGSVEPGPPPSLDPERHYLEGSREDVATYLLTLDAINFGSGWFPTIRKRPGCSGYHTVAWALADRFRAHGPYSGEELRALDARGIAGVLGQDPAHELMARYAGALNDLGRWLGPRTALEAVGSGSAGGLARPPAARKGVVR